MIRLPCCKLNICINCLQRNVSVNKNTSCPNCKNSLPSHIIEKHIPQSTLEQITYNNVIQFNCPSKHCKEILTIIPADYNELSFVECHRCKLKVCIYCKDALHTNEMILCPKLRKDLSEIIGTMRDGIVCPVCRNFFDKFEIDCDIVECKNCMTSLCFKCACLMDPVIGHGNHFHRNGCPHYRKNPKDTKIYNPEKCKRCFVERYPCQTPESFEEYCLKLVDKQTYLNYFKPNLKL